jgi:biopolymer transport protein ExbB
MRIPKYGVALVGLIALALFSGVAWAEEGGEAGGGVGFFTVAKNMSFMGYILLLLSIAGVALFLQAVVQIRGPILRPPGLAQELISLCEEGNLDEAASVAQSDTSMLGVIAAGTLGNFDRGKEAMQEAMFDSGEIEMNRFNFKIGILQLIGAVAPMLGLTGTTLGMIKTFAVIGVKADAVSPSDMAIGISEALVCTFLGLFIAIPLIAGAYFLKGKLTQTAMEIVNDVNEMIRASNPEGAAK